MRLLKRVSRSFYLSLRLLPAPMRAAAAHAYLLARASDSVADCAEAATEQRFVALDELARATREGSPDTTRLQPLVELLRDPAEAQLLSGFPDLLNQLPEFSKPVLELIRRVIGTIISGQRLDLEVFAGADRDRPLVFGDRAAVEDYTYRVAGCVGEFWTRLAHLTLGESRAGGQLDSEVEHAIAYGKGLQWINILRDLPSDLHQGRCYLPVADPLDRRQLQDTHRLLCQHARGLVECGLRYASGLRNRRLRTASVLPALLAIETLDLLDHAGARVLERRLKISRASVYRLLAEAFLY